MSYFPISVLGPVHVMDWYQLLKSHSTYSQVLPDPFIQEILAGAAVQQRRLIGHRLYHFEGESHFHRVHPPNVHGTNFFLPRSIVGRYVERL